MEIAYSRVSRKHQDLEKSKTLFKIYEKDMIKPFDEIILETVSGYTTRLKDRKLWKYIINTEVKKITIEEVSRFARNIKDGLLLIDYIEKHRPDLKVYFISPKITVKKSLSAEDEFTFLQQILQAQRESRLISERTKKGQQQAKKNGKRLGRPIGTTKITEDDKVAIRTLLSFGTKKNKIAPAVGLSRATLYNYLKSIDDN